MTWVTFTKDYFLALAFIGEFSISKWLGHCTAQLGVVHKLRLQDEVGKWSKMSTFCQRSYRRKCQCRGVGGQKKKEPKSCQRSYGISLIVDHKIKYIENVHKWCLVFLGGGGVKRNRTRGVGRGAKIGRPIILDFFSNFFSLFNLIC